MVMTQRALLEAGMQHGHNTQWSLTACSSWAFQSRQLFTHFSYWYRSMLSPGPERFFFPQLCLRPQLHSITNLLWNRVTFYSKKRHHVSILYIFMKMKQSSVCSYVECWKCRSFNSFSVWKGPSVGADIENQFIDVCVMSWLTMSSRSSMSGWSVGSQEAALQDVDYFSFLFSTLMGFSSSRLATMQEDGCSLPRSSLSPLSLYPTPMEQFTHHWDVVEVC